MFWVCWEGRSCISGAWEGVPGSIPCSGGIVFQPWACWGSARVCWRKQPSSPPGPAGGLSWTPPLPPPVAASLGGGQLARLAAQLAGAMNEPGRVSCQKAHRVRLMASTLQVKFGVLSC